MNVLKRSRRSSEGGEGFVTTMGDWADLPSDLLTLIAKRVDQYEDFAAFGGVCRSWRSVAVKENFNLSAQPQVPWLMLAEAKRQNQRSFVSLRKGGMFRKVELQGARSWLCCISSKGWLITSNVADEMALMHPLTGVRISLPHPASFKYYYGRYLDSSHEILLDRAVLSASPSETEDYVLMVIIRGCIAFLKPGNKIWSVIETKREGHPFVECFDVIYYKDQFYAINKVGELLCCDMCSGMSRVVGKIHDQEIANDTLVYLVECGGELLLVSGRVRHQADILFRVFKFNMISSKKKKFKKMNYFKCQEIYDLGGSSIFVGSGATAVTASDAAGTKSNCIYYADGYANQCVTLYSSREEGTGMCKWGGQTGQLQDRDMTFGNIWVSPSF